MSGKNKKKKNVPMSLSDFHASVPSTAASADSTQSVTTPAPSAQLVRINWAAEMEKYDDGNSPTDFVFDRSKLPTAPKSTLGPDIDLETVPKKAPFNAYIANVSFEADEEKLRKFFKDLKIVSVRLNDDEGNRSKGTGCIEFADRDSLISALTKNDTVFMNRPLRISLEERSHGDRYNNRGGFNQDNQSSLKSDEADWRRKEPEQEQQQQPHQQYHNKSYNNRYGQNRGGDQQHRGGYSRGGRGGGLGGNNNPNYRQGSGRQNYNQNKTYNEYGNHHRNEQYQHGGRLSDQHAGPAESTTETTSPQAMVERPKIMIQPRSVPIEDKSSAVVQSSIFGGAKPVDTAAKEREIEERLKKNAEKEAAERAATKVEQDENEQTAEDSSSNVLESDNNNNKNTEHQNYHKPQSSHQQQQYHQQQRSHKTSVTSEDNNRNSQSSRSHDNEFQTVGAKRHHNKNHDNNNRNQNRVPQSNSFTSPNYNQQYRQQQHHTQYENRPKNISTEQSKPPENVWKNRQTTVELFNKDPNTNVQNESASTGTETTQNRPPTHHRPAQYGSNNPHNKQNRPRGSGDTNKRYVNSAGGDRKQTDRRNNNNRDRQYNNNNRNNNNSERPPYQQKSNYEPNYQSSDQHDSNDLGFNNKFSNLKIDVGDVDDEVDEE